MDSLRLFCRWLKLNLSVNDSRGATCAKARIYYAAVQRHSPHVMVGWEKPVNLRPILKFQLHQSCLIRAGKRFSQHQHLNFFAYIRRLRSQPFLSQNGFLAPKTPKAFSSFSRAPHEQHTEGEAEASQQQNCRENEHATSFFGRYRNEMCVRENFPEPSPSNEALKASFFFVEKLKRVNFNHRAATLLQSLVVEAEGEAKTNFLH